MSSSLCAADTNAASNCEGGKYTPRAAEAAVKTPEALAIALGGVGPGAHRPAVEEQREHRADALHDAGHLRVAQRALEPDLQSAGRAPRGARRPRASSARERRQAGRDRERIAAQRARLVHGAERRDTLHDLALAAVHGERHAAADDLAEAGHVRGHAEQPLRAAGATGASRS